MVFFEYLNILKRRCWGEFRVFHSQTTGLRWRVPNVGSQGQRVRPFVQEVIILVLAVRCGPRSALLP